MRDFLPADVRKRNYVINIIKEVYESYGFEPLETPAVENIETLMGKYGEEGNQLVFKILKRGEKLDESLESIIHSASSELKLQEASLESLIEKASLESKIQRAVVEPIADLALRYDLTVPLARVVANNRNDLPKFFKRYQIQPVWRADRPARGRFREFYQCDVDAIGSESMVVEAELISAVSEVMRRLGFKDFTIRVNHRKLLTEILNVAGVSEDKHAVALIALDKLDKIGREGVAKEFLDRGVSKSSSEKLLIFFESLIASDFKDVVGKYSVKRLIDLQKRLAEMEDILTDRKKQFEAVNEASLNLNREIAKVILRLNESGSSYDGSELKKSANLVATLSNQAVERIRMMENLYKLKALLQFLSDDPAFESDGVNELSNLLKPFRLQLNESSDSSSAFAPIVVDPTLARGLSYYTGAIMEINVPDLAGSLGGGGRYDGLIGMFGKEQIPACGFSLGLERIWVVMEERGMFPPEIAESNSADVMVTIWNEETINESLKLANDLRKQGLRVTVYPEADKLGKQIKYADLISVPFVCVLGESELAENKVTLKNMKTGEQETLAREEIRDKVCSSH